MYQYTQLQAGWFFHFPSSVSRFHFPHPFHSTMPLISLPELCKQRVLHFASLILTFSLIVELPASHHWDLTYDEQQTINIIYSRDPSSLLSVGTVLANWLQDTCIYCLYWGNSSVVVTHQRSGCPTAVGSTIESFIRQLGAACRKQVQGTANCWRCLLPDPSTKE